MQITTDKILHDANTVKPLQDQFMDFVRMKEGKPAELIYHDIMTPYTR